MKDFKLQEKPLDLRRKEPSFSGHEFLSCFQMGSFWLCGIHTWIPHPDLQPNDILIQDAAGFKFLRGSDDFIALCRYKIIGATKNF
jgi:hypothetical protein